MQSDIELLLKLQVIDYDLGELERSKEYLPDMMGNLNNEIQDVQRKLDESTTMQEEANLKQKSLELEIKTKEAELQKYQQQMMSIKTNKEYDALVAQIDAVKSEISVMKQQETETMEIIDKLEQEIPDFTKKNSEIKVNNSKQLEVLQAKIDSIGDTMSGKESEREAILSKIPRPTVSIYERVRKGKGGAAVVVVKRRSCSSCNKALTPKKVQEIRRSDRINTCESCGRMLYWDDDISN
jgi:uncharacterized protein